MNDFFLYGDFPRLVDMSEVIGIDTETTGLTWISKLLGISLAWTEADGNTKGCYFSSTPGLFADDVWPAEQVTNFLLELFDSRLMVGHYSSFDARVLFRSFRAYPKRYYDTWHIVRSVEWSSSYSLSTLVSTKLKIKDSRWTEEKQQRANLEKLSPLQVSEYAIKDAKYCLMLFNEYYPRYQATGLEDTDIRFTNLTYQIMERGFPINEPLLAQRIKTELKTFLEVQDRLQKQGLNNPNSVHQVMRALKVRGIKAESTGASDLEMFLDNPFVQDIVTFGQLNSNLYARLLVFQKYNDEGRLHAEWHPYGTVSYRMVAKDPNLMAQPLKDRDGRAYTPLAEIFVPEDKYILQLDISQAEVRLAAMLSKSDDLATVLASGEDPYMQMAKRAYGVANKETRTKAKRATLASIYEEGPRAFSEKHGVTYEEAFDILDQFRQSYPHIKKMSNSYMEYAKANGFINLFTGRKIFFSKSDERLYRAFNQEIQGGIAELMREFMFRIEARFPGAMIGQIHDSVVLEFPMKEMSRQFIEEVKTIAGREIKGCIPEKAYALTTPTIPLLLDAEPFVRKIDADF